MFVQGLEYCFNNAQRCCSCSQQQAKKSLELIGQPTALHVPCSQIVKIQPTQGLESFHWTSHFMPCTITMQGDQICTVNQKHVQECAICDVTGRQSNATDNRERKLTLGSTYATKGILQYEISC